MAFDAGMLAAALCEINATAAGARIEKVNQPERDEIVLLMRTFTGGKRLLINAGSNNPRLGLTSSARENPPVPPMFCTLLRKYLSGAKLVGAKQQGFERVAELTFECRDEMGFDCTRYLVAEIMGKYSNLIFLDENRKIVQALRQVDFTTSRLRQVLPGMTYEAPPAQDKTDPLGVDKDAFAALFMGVLPEKSIEKWISATFLGISATVAREIAFTAAGRCDATLGETDPEDLWDAFDGVISRIREGRFEPCLAVDPETHAPLEYAFLPLHQYGETALRRYDGAGEVLDLFFDSRDREIRVRQRAADVQRILNAAQARLHKKIELQRAELAECEHGEEYKRQGDLITANLHLIGRGDRTVEVTDYEDWHEDGTYGTVRIELDGRLSPTANAQRMYKKYAKAKNAKVELTKQLEIGQNELDYIESVVDALNHSENVTDLAEIREELYRSGYASRMKTYASRKPGSAPPAVACFRTSGGYRVLCGKNNLQNEYITHKVAGKDDYWFHIKNRPGSHVVMLSGGEEPDARDFTEAAEIAAFYSSGAGGQNIPVDYTLVRHLHKTPGAKPGFVIYHTNWTAYVTPDPEKIRALREK